MSQPVRQDRVARFTEKVGDEAGTLSEMEQRMTCPVEGIEGGKPESLAQICAAWDIPYGRFLTWLMGDERRYAAYLRALEVAAHALVSEVVEIADGDRFPQEKRVRIDARFRLAQFHAPKMYTPREERTLELGQSFTDALLEISRRRLREMPAEPRVIEHDEGGEI